MYTLNLVLFVYLILELFSILLYVPRMIYWFQGFKKQNRLVNNDKNKFGLIIAAKNESKIINTLFNTIKKQTYDKKYYDIHIIVDNENDLTLDIAKRQFDNVKTYVVKNQTKKADALDGCFKAILADKSLNYDAYIIIDADSMLTENFLEEMNNAMVTGADVIIGRKRIKNWESKNKKNRNLIANISSLTYAGVDSMGNKARSSKGYAMNLCGQGMLIKSNVIKDLGGYPFKSLTEDYELGIECIRKKYKTQYYEYAEIYTEESPSHKVYNQRRFRWLKGYAQSNKKYKKDLIKQTFKNYKTEKGNLGFLFGTYPLFLIFGFSFLAILIFLSYSAYFLIWGVFDLFIKSVLYAFIVFGIIYFECSFYAFITVLQDRDINKMTFWEKTKVVLFSPLILLEYGFIFLKAYFSGDNDQWICTERIEM